MTDVTVDCAVHPTVRRPDDLRAYMDPPWRDYAFPAPGQYPLVAPSGPWSDEAKGDPGLPGSEPDGVLANVLDARGVDYAVLAPLTRGLSPDADLASAICQGTNRWLAEVWLEEGNPHGRFFGSIRVNPADPDRAVREIEHWAQDPRMVQVAVATQAHAPYGERKYWPVWQAAAAHGLPIGVYSEDCVGVEFPPSPAGKVRTSIEYYNARGMLFAYHLASIIGGGVLERFPDVRFVFGDGGFELSAPILWRFESGWRPSRPLLPWISKPPEDYMKSHVRFCWDEMGPADDPAMMERWAEISGGSEVLLYASKYPNFGCVPRTDAKFDKLPADLRRTVLSNGASFYRLEGRLAPR